MGKWMSRLLYEREKERKKERKREGERERERERENVDCFYISQNYTKLPRQTIT